MIGAVIFDCDGTLVDSEPVARAAWGALLAEHGAFLTDDDWEAVIGTTFPVTYTHFRRRAPLPDEAETWDKFARRVLGAIRSGEMTAFPDAVQAVHDLVAAGVAVAVASSSPRIRLDATLEAAGLEATVPVTISGDDVRTGKPEPEAFLRAAQALGADPERCLVVEDSAIGVAAGRNAGMVVVGVVHHPGDRSRVAAADHVTDRLTAPQLRSWLPTPSSEEVTS
jgi:HAD superfamily hydrolase (TIGR01509 family)